MELRQILAFMTIKHKELQQRTSGQRFCEIKEIRAAKKWSDDQS